MLKQTYILLVAVCSALVGCSSDETTTPLDTASTFPAHNFKAKFLAYPEIHRQEQLINGRPASSTLYFHFAHFTDDRKKWFVVAVDELPGDARVLADAPFATTKDLLQDVFYDAVVRYSGTDISHSFTKLGRYDALDGIYSVDMPGQKGICRVRMLIVGNTSYTISSHSTTEAEHLAFRDSFQLLDEEQASLSPDPIS